MIKIFSVILLLIGLSGMTGSVTWILRRGNNNRVTRLFMLCQLSIILWLISQLLILFSVNREQRWLSYLIGNLGICIFSPLWLMFSAEFIDARPLVNRLMRFLPLISVTAAAVILTNPLHGLYYSDFSEQKPEYGILFYIFQVVYYICIITGITMMCVRHIKERDKVTNQTILLTLSAAVPMAINTLTVTGFIDTRIELTPLFFAFSSILILIALSRYGLLNINRIAINETIDNLPGGVIVFDADLSLTYFNKYAGSLLDLTQGMAFGSLASLLSEMAGRAVDPDSAAEEFTSGGHCYSLRQSFCRDKAGRTMARIVQINDVTEYFELAKAERQLSIEQERNRIAQEIHDSAGHTFTLISSIAKVLLAGDISGQEDEKLIREIDGLSRSGVTQLRCSINNLRDDEFMTSVEKAVRSVASSLRGMECELCFQGEEEHRFDFCIREVYDNCRELITNAMRYSEAKRIDLIVKFLADRLEIYIFDNGKGCGDIRENNGLRGIRERTEALGGSVRFTSVPGDGFAAVMKIPAKEQIL